MNAPRWKLYKLISEPTRLRLLALTGEAEFAIGELAELLEEAQPGVSRHLKALRESGLVETRREGTRVLARLAPSAHEDPVVADALATGLSLCREERRLGRIRSILEAREAASRAHFDASGETSGAWPSELPAYLAALAPLIPNRSLAIDAGTGDGAMLEVLAPVFDRVIAFDRSSPRLAEAQARLDERGYTNVELSHLELGEAAESADLRGKADAVFAARVLHHASVPKNALRHLANLAAPTGSIIVVDYAEHSDERLRAEHADAWLGFSAEDLRALADEVGLVSPHISTVPAARCAGGGHDGHLDWNVLVARVA